MTSSNALAFGLAALLPLGPVAATANPLPNEETLIQLDLVSGWEIAPGQHMAGLRLSVADGWKTYWRAPGDAGVPPRFDFSGSENLADVTVHWPMPEVFDSWGMQVLGYTGEVVLPIELTAIDPTQPIHLAGIADLGVCSDVCLAVTMPMQNQGEPAQQSIQRAMGDLPQSAQEAGVGAMACQVTPTSDGVQLTATIELPKLGGKEIAVVEMRREDVWISMPQLERRGKSLQVQADFVPPEAAPFALDHSELRLTLLGRKGAVEFFGCPTS
ncbi:MAG: protein-disulfide reductase DsbD domain-containing protein [Mangrovicoccus sp.]